MKMTKTPTITRPEPSHEVSAFEDERARITKECARLTAQISQSQAELATLAERERQRSEQETAAQTNVDTARQAYQEAQLRAELLTSGEMAKGAQKELGKLESQLRADQDSQLKLLNRIQQEADADDRKAFRLREAIARDTETIHTLQERQRIAENLKQKAQFEQAETALRAHLDTVRAMQAQRDIQRSTLARMEDEIAQYVNHAQKELASFPEQQSAFSANFEYNDVLTGLLQAQIDFIGLVLATGRSAPELPLEVTRKAGTYWQGLAELLSLDAAHLRPALARESQVRLDALLERRELLTKLLSLYKETKA